MYKNNNYSRENAELMMFLLCPKYINFTHKRTNFNTISMLVRRHTRTNTHTEIYLHAQIQYVKNALKNVLISM